MQESNNFGQNNDGSLGIFTVIAMVLLLWGFCWLKSYYPFHTMQRIKVIFPEIAGLNENAGVFVDGVRVGCVEKLAWQNAKCVLVVLRINHPKVIIPQGSKFEILSNGIIGAKYVDITLPPASENIALVPINKFSTVLGEDPVRPEIVLNKLSKDLNKVDIDHLGKGLAEDRQIFRRAANDFSALATKTMPVVERALPLEDQISVLSTNLSRTSQRLNKLLDNPDISHDLKETVLQAKETAQTAQLAIHELHDTLADKSLRQDLLNTVAEFNQSTTHLQSSMAILQQVSGDKDLRADTKQMLLDARLAMEKVDRIFSNPTFGTDLKITLEKTRAAIDNIDLAARQLNQILSKRHPLVHLLLGRPGYVKVKEVELHGPLPNNNGR